MRQYIRIGQCIRIGQYIGIGQCIRIGQYIGIGQCLRYCNTSGKEIFCNANKTATLCFKVLHHNMTSYKMATVPLPTIEAS